MVVITKTPLLVDSVRMKLDQRVRSGTAKHRTMRSVGDGADIVRAWRDGMWTQPSHIVVVVVVGCGWRVRPPCTADKCVLDHVLMHVVMFDVVSV